MKRKAFGLVIAIAAGAFSLVAAPPASALRCEFCTCSSSCDQVCRDGPFVQGCPECHLSTCGAWGVCDGVCGNNAFTTTTNGTSGGDTLTGTSANECIHGLGGNDTVYGNAGDDTVYASSGNDTVYGGSGDDYMYGEGGNDSLTGDTGSGDFADGGTGTDTCNAKTKISGKI